MSWYVLAAAVVVVCLVLVGRRRERPASARDLGASAPPTPERIDEYLRMGRKIEAIKAYRTAHGVDLKTAKDAVEARERELGR